MDTYPPSATATPTSAPPSATIDRPAAQGEARDGIRSDPVAPAARLPPIPAAMRRRTRRAVSASGACRIARPQDIAAPVLMRAKTWRPSSFWRTAEVIGQADTVDPLRKSALNPLIRQIRQGRRQSPMQGAHGPRSAGRASAASRRHRIDPEQCVSSIFRPEPP
jgi:hypothetical protein